MPREVSVTVGRFQRQLNKKPSCYPVHGAVAAEEGVSGLSVVSVVSAALLTLNRSRNSRKTPNWQVRYAVRLLSTS